jgi:hypothetical protein
MANFSDPGQLFSPTRVHTGEHQALANQKATRELGANPSDFYLRQDFGIFDLRTVNFIRSMPISTYRGHVPFYQAAKLPCPTQN